MSLVTQQKRNPGGNCVPPFPTSVWSDLECVPAEKCIPSVICPILARANTYICSCQPTNRELESFRDLKVFKYLWVCYLYFGLVKFERQEYKLSFDSKTYTKLASPEVIVDVKFIYKIVVYIHN